MSVKSPKKKRSGTVKRSRKKDSVVDSEPLFVEKPIEELANVDESEKTFDFLGIQVIWNEIVELASSKWQRRFLKHFRSLPQAILLSIPDCEGIEVLDEQLRDLDRQVSKGRTAVAIQSLLELALPEVAVDPTTQCLATLAVVYHLRIAIEQAPDRTKKLLRKLEGDLRKPFEQADQDPLVYLITTIEIPLVLSATLRGLDRGHAIGTNALDTFVLFLEKYFDLEGWISADHLAIAGPMFGGIIRSRKLINLSRHSIPESVQERCEWIGLQIARLLTGEGQISLAGGWVSDPKILMSVLGALTSDSQERRLYKRLLEGSKIKRGLQKLTSPGDYSQGARFGILRSDWSLKSPRMAIAIGPNGHRLQIGNRHTLIDSESAPQITINGRLSPFDFASLEMNCWHEDDGVHYLELEQKALGVGVWQRQYTLARQDRILFMMDALILEKPNQKIDYSLRLGIADETMAIEETENREIYLKRRERFAALLVPFTLGEWRTRGGNEDFRLEGRELVLERTENGRALFFGLAIDLDSKRAVRPRTWRPLTVAENMAKVSQDEAVAFRLAIGSDQWVIYRSLSSVGNRTFLGQNTYCDFCLSKFDAEGSFEKIIEIE